MPELLKEKKEKCIKDHLKVPHLLLAKLMDFVVQLSKGPLEVWLVC